MQTGGNRDQKVLSLGKLKINFRLRSLNRTLAAAEGTLARQTENKFSFALA